MIRHGTILEEQFATSAGEKGAGGRWRSIKLETRLQGARLLVWGTKLADVMVNAAATHSDHKHMAEGSIADAEVNPKAHARRSSAGMTPMPENPWKGVRS